MEINVADILLTEKDGSITASHKGSSAAAKETKRIWFDCNCPYCRRHWLDNLDSYQQAIIADELVLVLTPVAFLTQYSVQAGSLLLDVAPYGPEIFFDVFKALIFNGIGESKGNDEETVANKVKDVYETVIVPDLNAVGVSAEAFKDSITEAVYDQIQRSTKDAVDHGVTGVPHIETL
ncbi:MAG: thioredoxin domain-containing protein [Clostridiales Family XIII bacterium]|jgi:protein-disulfide isomerase|nr:thioredoxin domain-containing protein [Clostridiales Family XIII bacterium]